MNGPSNGSVTPDFTNGRITINKKGTYVLILSLSFKGTNERDYDISLFRNGLESDTIKISRFYGPNLITGDLGCGGLITIDTIPEVIDLRAKCNKSDANVMIVESASMTIFQLTPTVD